MDDLETDYSHFNKRHDPLWSSQAWASFQTQNPLTEEVAWSPGGRTLQYHSKYTCNDCSDSSPTGTYGHLLWQMYPGERGTARTIGQGLRTWADTWRLTVLPWTPVRKVINGDIAMVWLTVGPSGPQINLVMPNLQLVIGIPQYRRGGWQGRLKLVLLQRSKG